jgi:hypothetical protein
MTTVPSAHGFDDEQGAPFRWRRTVQFTGVDKNSGTTNEVPMFVLGADAFALESVFVHDLTSPVGWLPPPEEVTTAPGPVAVMITLTFVPGIGPRQGEVAVAQAVSICWIGVPAAVPEGIRKFSAPTTVPAGIAEIAL